MLGGMELSGLHERLRIAAGGRSLRHLGELTKTPPETVRRYLQGQAPGVEFLTAFCRALALSADWLLTGRGPMRLSEVKAHTLAEARAGELLTAMAGTIERLVERVERLEIYAQTLEARVRVSVAAGSEVESAGRDEAGRAQHGAASGAFEQGSGRDGNGSGGGGGRAGGTGGGEIAAAIERRSERGG